MTHKIAKNMESGFLMKRLDFLFAFLDPLFINQSIRSGYMVQCMGCHGLFHGKWFKTFDWKYI